MLIQAVVPTSVGLVVQLGNRMLAEASAAGFPFTQSTLPYRASDPNW
jgi:hypothetical protein